MLVAPAISGILLSLYGLAATLFLDFATAAVAIVVLSFLPFAPAIIDHESESNVVRDLKEGISYAKSNILIKSLLVFYGIFFFLVTPAAFLTPLMVERSFGSDVWRLTANEISWSLGCLIGGIIIASTGGFKNRIYTMGFSCMIFGFLFAFLGIAGNFTIYLVIMLFAGIFMPFFATAETVLIQEKVPEKLLGRVFSIIQIIASIVMPVGMIIFGPLADVVKIEYIMIFTGILMGSLGIYIFTNKKLVDLNDYQHEENI
jgi:DHA3 family macrolide efflux protein-like MFS transporter